MEYLLLLFIASTIVFAAFFIKGMTGFANSLIIVPLLSLFINVKTVIPISAILGLIASIILFPSAKKHIDKEFIPILLFVMIGTLIGTQLFIAQESNTLKIILGIVIIIFSIQLFINKTIKKIPRWWGGIAGITAGILGGLFTTNGPPLAIYFGNKLKKQTFRATLIMIFFIDAIWLNTLYIIRGITTIETIQFTLPLIPILIIALILGTKTHLKINETIFKRSVATILLAIGIIFLI